MFSFGFWWLWNYSWHFKGVYNGFISTAENWLTTTNAVHRFSLQNKCRLTIASYCLCFTLWKMCIKKFVFCCSLPQPQPPCCSKYQIDGQLLTAQPPEHGQHHHFTLTTMCSSRSTRPRLVSPPAPQLWENLCCSSQDNTAYPLIWKKIRNMSCLPSLFTLDLGPVISKCMHRVRHSFWWYMPCWHRSVATSVTLVLWPHAHVLLVTFTLCFTYSSHCRQDTWCVK